MEEWSLEEYFRGEAGYAFTNYHGAVQFLFDLKDASSLTHCSMATDQRNMSASVVDVVVGGILRVVGDCFDSGMDAISSAIRTFLNKL